MELGDDVDRGGLGLRARRAGIDRALRSRGLRDLGVPSFRHRARRRPPRRLRELPIPEHGRAGPAEQIPRSRSLVRGGDEDLHRPDVDPPRRHSARGGAAGARAAARSARAAGDRPRALARRRRTAADAAAADANRWPLTPAEIRLLHHLPTHLSFREIGKQLFVSPNTVKTQAQSVYRKFGVSSRAEAVECARAAGLLTDQYTPHEED